MWHVPWQEALQGRDNAGTPETQAGIPLHSQHIARPASCLDYVHGRELIVTWLGSFSTVNTQAQLSAIKENQLVLSFIVLAGLSRSSGEDSAFP